MTDLTDLLIVAVLILACLWLALDIVRKVAG